VENNLSARDVTQTLGRVLSPPRISKDMCKGVRHNTDVSVQRTEDNEY